MAVPRPRKTNNRGGSRSSKLRGLPNDSPTVRLSKTLSWLLRHGAQSQGLPMREDGYVRVEDLVGVMWLCSILLILISSTFQSQTAIKPQNWIRNLSSVRPTRSTRDRQCWFEEEVWFNLYRYRRGRWGRERRRWMVYKSQPRTFDQGMHIHVKNAFDFLNNLLTRHSTWQTVKLDLKPILTVDDIPTRIAVHGTTMKAWGEILGRYLFFFDALGTTLGRPFVESNCPIIPLPSNIYPTDTNTNLFLLASKGLSKMNRNHIHLAQGVSGENVISGECGELQPLTPFIRFFYPSLDSFFLGLFVMGFTLLFALEKFVCFRRLFSFVIHEGYVCILEL